MEEALFSRVIQIGTKFAHFTSLLFLRYFKDVRKAVQFY